MYKIGYILDELEATPSTNDKKAIILKYSGDEDFLRFIKLALDSGKKYGFKKLPDVNSTAECSTEDIFGELDQLALRQGDKGLLSAMCGHCHCEALVELILKKDLRCGVGARLINDVIPRHIDIVPYERYKSMKHLHKLDWLSRIIVQLKMNGLFSYYSVLNDLFTTRNNKTYTIAGVDYAELVVALNEDEPLVFIGEGLILGPDGEYLDRATSNGIVNSFIQSAELEYQKDFQHVVWLYITEAEYYQGFSTVTYGERFDKMIEAFDLVNPQHVRLCEYKEIKSLEEAHVFYKSKRKKKEEGAMPKDANKLCWSDNKSGTPHGCKMKARAEVDVEILVAYYGEAGKKWEHLLGGLVVRTCDGKIVTKVGMGFSDKQRELGVDHWNLSKGEVVTVAIGDVTKAKNKTTYAFESSSFIETRFNEKDTADSFQDCVDSLAKV